MEENKDKELNENSVISDGENKIIKIKLSTVILIGIIFVIVIVLGICLILDFVKKDLKRVEEQEDYNFYGYQKENKNDNNILENDDESDYIYPKTNEYNNNTLKNELNNQQHHGTTASATLEYLKKPIIYIYPEKEEKLSIKLGYPQKITSVYPEYNNGWNVTAKPNGTLTDEKTGKEYYSLYYECNNTKEYDEELKEGFVVSKENITKFLEEKLAILGLNEREAEEFIIYWLPKLQQYEYIYVRFQTLEEIEENMPLILSKTPDTLIRIMMEWKGLNEYIEVKEQELNPVTRSGFTVVEWGGTILK